MEIYIQVQNFKMSKLKPSTKQFVLLKLHQFLVVHNYLLLQGAPTKLDIAILEVHNLHLYSQKYL